MIIARVSTKQQDATGLSIEKIQLPQLRQYAIDKNFEIVREFVFQETAGQKLRKNFDEMVKYVKDSKDIKVIIGFRVDRLTRNFRDAVEMDALRVNYDKELHFVSDDLVLHKKSFGKEIKEWDSKVYLAKQHINNCQESSYDTLQSKLKNQEMYGMAPYGYENCKSELGESLARIKVYEAGIVKQIFDWYTSGSYSYLLIAQKLRSEYKINFHKSKVEKILKNRFYMGFREVNGIIYPHKFQTIVSKEIWEMAEAIRNGRGLHKKKGKLISRHGMYSGLIYCKECGCSMTAEAKTKKQQNGNIHHYTYYHCTGSKGKHSTGSIEEKKLTEQFADIYRTMKLPDEDITRMVNTLKEAHKGKIEFNEEAFDEINNHIKRLTRKIENLYDDKLEDRITQDVYDNLSKKFRQEQQEYKDKLARLERADEEYYITSSYLLELATRSYDLFIGSEPEEKKAIIQLTLQNLCFNNGKLVYELQKPFDSIFESAKSLSWGG